jgi:glucose/arabinose dehydrogenase
MPNKSVITRIIVAAACCAFTFFYANNFTVRAITLPPDFEDALVATIGAPTALAFTPDGRLLITTQGGQVRVFQNGALLSTPAVNLNARLCTNSERGLLGIAVDPAFATNRYIYLYYTFKKTAACDATAVNRVARFTLADNNAIDTATELILIDNIHSPAGNHNGGDLHFGKDGLLYVSVGDGGCDYANNSGCAGANDAARDKHVLLGKILRITKTGAIPASNPYQGAGTGRCNVTGSTTPGNWCQETFASGLRNPFRISFDSNASATRFFINDVGQNVWEEIDEGIAGADYGWNLREGRCANGSSTNCGAPPAGLTNPIFDYPHTSNCSASGIAGNSITGGAFVPNGVWSSAYDNSYLFGEYVCGKIFKLSPNGAGGYTASEFATGLGGSSAVAMIFGPFQSTQALFYTTYAAGGQVRRIRYAGTTNRNPNAVAVANPTSGAAPLDVMFDASNSTDPDGDPLTFNWNFGDGASGTGAAVTHRYNSVGTYTAVVTVTDGRGGTASATVRIDVGNSPPQPVITSPTATQLFRVGETVTLTGSATDPQEGTLPASRLTWEVVLHHDDHTHPWVAPTAGNNIAFTTPAPEDLAAATNSRLEIKLTATDSQGLSTTVSQNFNPRKVNVTFATNPAGLNLTVNGTTVTGSTTVVSWDGYVLNVNAPNQTSGGQTYNFVSWSDAGAQSHAITTPSTAASYTASFQAAGGGGNNYTVAATPTTVNAGAPITVNWTAPAGHSGSDWIAIYSVGAPNTAYGAWSYTGTATSGTMTFTAPSASGQYEIRYLLNNGYTAAATSAVITVQVPTNNNYSLAATPATVSAGAPITVNWTAPAGHSPSDWVGLFRVGDPNTAYLNYQYTTSATSGTMTFNAPATPGQYEFRYLLNNGYTSAVTSNTVTVQTATTNNYTLTASPATVSPGGQTTVSWTAPSGSSSVDWIALYRVGAANSSYLAWQYTGGATSGTFTFTVPTAPGQYEFRYLLNDGYTSVKTSNTVTVGSGFAANAPDSLLTGNSSESIADKNKSSTSAPPQ